MTPHRTFSHKPRAPVRDKRRKRWVERWSVVIATAGGALELLALLLDRVSRPDVLTVLPESWRPYVVGASVMAGLAAVSERHERRRDYQRWIERQERTPAVETTPLPRRINTPPPNDT